MIEPSREITAPTHAECDWCRTRHVNTAAVGQNLFVLFLTDEGWWIGPEYDCLCPSCAAEVVQLVNYEGPTKLAFQHGKEGFIGRDV